jgi:DNA-binding NarL/FixJ family response regulator
VIISSALGLLISKVYSYKTKTLVEPINLAPIETTLLTKRELEVLLLLSKGYTNNQISNELFVSLNTTKTHLSNIYSKLGTRNRVQTIRIAQNNGLL